VIADPLDAARLLPEKGEIRMRRGDVLRLCQSGGGGYGDPLRRPPEAVRADVRNGLVTVQTAREVYGVVLTAEDGEVDLPGTATAREALRRRRGNNPPATPVAVPARQHHIDAVIATASRLRGATRKGSTTNESDPVPITERS